MSPNTKLRRTLALALSGGSLAIGVPAALAAGGSDSGTSSDSGAPATRLVQDEQQQQQPDRPNGEGQQNGPGHDCPERDGAQGEGEGGSSGSSDSGTSTPEV